MASVPVHKFVLFFIYPSLVLLLDGGVLAALSKHPVLIVVSFDAFRYNFIDTLKLPQMEAVRNRGVHAPYLVNVFPTKTFPNHHSIATGLYPEVHGVIGNTFYDPESEGKIIKIGYEMYHYSEAVKPIWRFNEDLGDGRHSGTVMWPGGDYAYQGKNITWKMPFESGFDWYKRVDQALTWITDTEKPANLVMIYFEEPDTHGHAFGPNSDTVINLIRKLDNITGYLHHRLKTLDLADKVNVVHLSDHGMSAVTPPKFINITQYIRNGTYDWAGASPAIQIWPHKGYEQTIYDALKSASVTKGHFQVYNKTEFPERWHYANNRRSPPILVMADEGYALDDLIRAAPLYAQKYNFTLTNQSEFGVHGYDYTVPDMRPIFMAVGPKFKQRTQTNPFHTVDLFNVFCAVLNLPAEPNNGSFAPAIEILHDDHQYGAGTIVMISLGAVLLVLVVATLVTLGTLVVIKRRQTVTTAAALNKRFPQQTFQNYVEAQHLLEPEEA